MRVKLCAAVVGVSAAFALGALGAATTPADSVEGPAIVSAGEMTMGDTATADYTETSVQTSMAVPGDKASPPCGFSDSC
jgi:hypothetical protein